MIAKGVLLALVLFGLILIEKAFAVFSSDTVILLLGLLSRTAALMHTGVVGIVSRHLLQYTSDHVGRLLLVTMLAGGLLSAIIKNTAAAAFSLLVILGLSLRSNFSAPRLLMPIAFAVVLASTVTLISTSTYVIVSRLIV